MKDIRLLFICLLLNFLSAELNAQWPLFDLGTSGEIGGVYVKGDQIYVTGEAGLFKMSEDCGITWMGVNSNFINDIGEIEFVNDDVGYVAADDGWIGKTSDGGVTWEFMNTPAPDNIESTHFVEQLVGFLVGREGAIIFTNDGGTSWLSQNSGVTTRLEDVYFHNSSEGIVVGRNSTLLHTNDGGGTWNSISGSWGDLKSIDFIDPQNGFIATEGGVYKVNGNLSQIDFVELDPMVDFNDIHFANNQLGWICGELGTVYQTNDGGQTWNLILLNGPIYELESIHGSSMEMVFTGGEFGKVNGVCGAVTGLETVPDNHLEIHDLQFDTNTLNLMVLNGNDEEVEILLIDITGKTIFNLSQYQLSDGNHSFNFKNHIAKGIYVLSFQFDYQTRTIKILKP